jgi:hypothetical protein
VSGELGACRCSWELRIVVDEEGSVAQNRVVNISPNCREP